MLELSEELKNAMNGHPEEPVRLIDSSNQKEFVLLRAEEYERLSNLDYDASPWTHDEMNALAEELADSLGWEGMEAYQEME